ncbi:hypothetical protein OU789_10760 [Halocynthiibacter sp. C4]|uniref:hypothetical protein n=1 Tax=Halocynthiibacter sp. C4 TaxID=2992758 RepID=UPI00237A4DAB|nr:hypothetical protein [Halocynthiibacter sp. C4]MDE0590407.1 hypothetical protein [Halocynthiibacter sp. C4]
MAKTYKRETSWAMLLFLAALVVWGPWNPEAKEAARFLSTYIFIFAGGAFGLDAIVKQWGA